jgi:hypothetical protein
MQRMSMQYPTIKLSCSVAFLAARPRLAGARTSTSRRWVGIQGRYGTVVAQLVTQPVRGQLCRVRSLPLACPDAVGMAGFESAASLRPELRTGRSMGVVFARRGPLVATLRRCRSTRLLYFAAVQLRSRAGLN